LNSLNLLRPYTKNQKDIFGREDINNLLGKYQDIEKKHFKLWLSSASILENIIHSRILREAEYEIEDILRESKKYVINESFEKALNIIREHYYCIIAGIPGIGKTILAKMLALQYINDGYELITISRDISDVNVIPMKDKPRIYLYDDFLGGTSITEKLGKNEDHRLVSLIKRIKHSKRERLILTTREYILHQAQDVYERLNSPLFETPQCIVDLSSYTRKIRADILYNHLYFSEIKKDYLISLVKNSSYLEIIDHPNFNPRIIDNLTNPMWITGKSNSDYFQFFLDVLCDPILIWKNVFRSQISEYARLILTILVSLPKEVFLDDLKKIFMNYTFNKGFQCDVEILFDRALRELEGNFTITYKQKEEIVISFHNPSIADFMQNELERIPKALYQILQHAIFFEQIEFVLDSDARHKSIIENFAESKSLISEKVEQLIECDSCKISLYRGAKGEKSYKDRSPTNIGSRFSYLASRASKENYSYLLDFFRSQKKNIFAYIQGRSFRPEELVRILKYLIPMSIINEDETKNLLLISKESILKSSNWIIELEEIYNFFEFFPQMKSSSDNKRIKERATSIVDELTYSEDYELLDDELTYLRLFNTCN